LQKKDQAISSVILKKMQEIEYFITAILWRKDKKELEK